jgi:hypothetical protein
MVLIRLGKKKINVNGKECKGLGKLVGLMFSGQDAKPRIFKFKRPTKMPIHSLFCPGFLAIWLLKGRVIDYEFVDKTRLSIRPASGFDMLIEIPINKKHEKIIKHFKKED